MTKKKVKEIAPLKLDLGAGTRKQEGFLGVDCINFPGIDIVADLTKKWPWKDNSVAEIHASHFIEHLDAMQRVHFVNETYRVLVPGGKATLIAPHWASCRAYGDPTHCFAEDTFILAESGWRPITSIKVGERVLSMDLTTEKTQLTPVIQTINEPYTGEMLHFKTVRMDLLVTPNHDLVWRSKSGNANYYKQRNMMEPRPILRKSAAESFVGMGGHHPRRGTAIINWEGESPKTIRIANDVKNNREHNKEHNKVEFDAGDFAELLGWYVSEGSTCFYDKHYQIHIAQSSEANPNKVQQIVNLLRRMGFKPQIKPTKIVFNSKVLALWLHKLGLSHQKYVPNEIKKLSPPLLKRFLDSAVKGDGRSNGNGKEYMSTSRQLAEDVQEIAIKAGYRTSLGTERRVGMKTKIKDREITAKFDIHRVRISPPTDIWYPQPKSIQYDGYISCVTLAEHHNIYVRRNGKPIWSGNCWPPVSEFWFYYLSKEWRMGNEEKGLGPNAPHTDAKNLENGFNCDFDITWGYNLHPALSTRNQETQQFMTQFYKEAVSDIIATLIKK